MLFDEFRVVVQPELPDTGKWEIRVQKSPRPLFVGQKGLITPVVRANDLARLRNATALPNVLAMQQLGQDVVNSIMTSDVQVALSVSLDDANRAGKGLRIVVAIVGSAKPPNGVGCHEIPVEAFFTPTLNFLATNRRTPVSRGVTVEADRPPARITPPLRILVVASEPANMPPVNAALEIQGLSQGVQHLVNVGAVKLEFCTPATPERLDAMVQKETYHIVHFIGHGDFDLDGIDQNPQAYLYFEDGTPQRKRRPVDAVQLFTMLQNGNVPLIVMTACASAASQPNGPDYYPGLAFEGLAQTLVARQGGPLAAIAMQFDLESDAAAIFSRVLYEQLLSRQSKLDSAVATARAALVNQFGPGHRSWVNPTVYWRCVDGTLFDYMEVEGTLTPEQRAELNEIVTHRQVIEEHLTDLAGEPPEIFAGTARLRAQWQSEVEKLEVRRGALLGDTVRLRGGTLAPDGSVSCQLGLRLRLGARIGDITVRLAPDVADFEYVGASDGSAVAPGSVFPRQDPNGHVVVLVQNVSGNAEWTAGEYTLANVKFRALNAGGKPLFRLPIAEAAVTRNGVHEANFGRLDALVFNA